MLTIRFMPGIVISLSLGCLATVLMLTGFTDAAVRASVPVAKSAVDPSLVAAADFMPHELLAVLTVKEPDRKLAAIRTFLDEKGFEETGLYRVITTAPKFEAFRSGVTGIAGKAGVEVWPGFAALLGKELSIGFKPGKGEEPQMVGALVPRDPETFRKVIDALHRTVGFGPLDQPDPDRYTMVQDCHVFSTDKKVFHCLVNNVLVFANRIELIESALEAGRKARNRLSASKTYNQAKSRVNGDAWAYLDTAKLRTLLAGGKNLPVRLKDPMAGLLFGGWWHQILHSDLVVSWTEIKEGELKLKLSVKSGEAFPSTHRGFMVANTDASMLHYEKLPHFIGEFSVTRNWADLLEERENLYTLSAAGKIVEFTNVLTTLMGGLDFVDEFLPCIAGPVTLVALRRDLSELDYETTPKLPAFALTAPLAGGEAEGMAKRIRTAALMSFSFMNYQAAGERRPAFMIDMENYRGVSIIKAEYPEPEAGELMDVRYNFAPAATLVDGRLIIGSTREVVADLIDMMKSPGDQDAPSPPDCFKLEVGELMKILNDNHEEMVAGRMLKEGESRVEAEAVLKILDEVAGYFKRFQLTSLTAQRASEAELCLVLR